VVIYSGTCSGSSIFALEFFSNKPVGSWEYFKPIILYLIIFKIFPIASVLEK